MTPPAPHPRLAARARRVALLRRRVVAAVLASFALAWGTIAYSGSLGAETTTASTQATTDSGAAASTQSDSGTTSTTQSDSGATSTTQSDDGSASTTQSDTPSAVTTQQS